MACESGFWGGYIWTFGSFTVQYGTDKEALSKAILLQPGVRVLYVGGALGHCLPLAIHFYCLTMVMESWAPFVSLRLMSISLFTSPWTKEVKLHTVLLKLQLHPVWLLGTEFKYYLRGNGESSQFCASPLKGLRAHGSSITHRGLLLAFGFLKCGKSV